MCAPVKRRLQEDRQADEALVTDGRDLDRLARRRRRTTSENTPESGNTTALHPLALLVDRVAHADGGQRLEPRESRSRSSAGRAARMRLPGTTGRVPGSRCRRRKPVSSATVSRARPGRGRRTARPRPEPSRARPAPPRSAADRARVDAARRHRVPRHRALLGRRRVLGDHTPAVRLDARTPAVPSCSRPDSTTASARGPYARAAEAKSSSASFGPGCPGVSASRRSARDADVDVRRRHGDRARVRAGRRRSPTRTSRSVAAPQQVGGRRAGAGRAVLGVDDRGREVRRQRRPRSLRHTAKPALRRRDHHHVEPRVAVHLLALPTSCPKARRFQGVQLQSIPPETARPARVIGVAASAGGVEALRRLVRPLPADLDAALCVVLHIPRHRPQPAGADPGPRHRARRRGSPSTARR